MNPLIEGLNVFSEKEIKKDPDFMELYLGLKQIFEKKKGKKRQCYG